MHVKASFNLISLGPQMIQKKIMIKLDVLLSPYIKWNVSIFTYASGSISIAIKL